MYHKENIVFDNIKNIHKIFSDDSDILILSCDGYEASIAESVYDSIRSNLKNSNINIVNIAPGDNSKNIKTVQYLWDKFNKYNINKDSVILAIGGGALSDLAGFAASTYLRGVRFYNIPTSFVSMLDASIGGKRAINFKSAKNQIGTFYNADTVFVDVNLLETLSLEQYQCGLCEAIKMAFICGDDLFTYIKDNADCIKKFNSRNSEKIKNLIQLCIDFKQNVCKEDYFDDKGIRIFLNYGHSFGHALESHFNHEISHGLAIACGMDFAAFVLGNEQVYNEQISIFKKYEIFDAIHKIKQSINIDNINNIAKYFNYDKKAKFKEIDFVVIENIACPKVVKISQKDIMDFLIKYIKEI